MRHTDCEPSAHLDDQITILAQIKVHAKLERIAGQEIKPAARNQDLSEVCKVADDRKSYSQLFSETSSTMRGA